MRLDYENESATWGMVRFYWEERNALRKGRPNPRLEALDDLVSRQLHSQLAEMLMLDDDDDNPFRD